MKAVNFLPLIESKRDGKPLTGKQLSEITSAVVAGRIPDYQIASFLMAVFFRGLNTEETTALTLAMRDSGELLKIQKDARPLAVGGAERLNRTHVDAAHDE